MKSNKIVKLFIPGANGHTELAEPLEQAVETVVAQARDHKLWTTIDGDMFHWETKFRDNAEDKAKLEADKAKLRALFETKEDPAVMFMGQLRGGE